MLLQLPGLHLNGEERVGGGGTWGRQGKKVHAGKVLRVSKELKAAVAWWRWHLGEGEGQVGERITAPSFSFAKQVTSRRWFSDFH